MSKRERREVGHQIFSIRRDQNRIQLGANLQPMYCANRSCSRSEEDFAGSGSSRIFPSPHGCAAALIVALQQIDKLRSFTQTYEEAALGIYKLYVSHP